MSHADAAEWSRRALAVLTAKFDEHDPDLSREMFEQLIAADPDAHDPLTAAMALATGMGNLATLLVDEVAMLRGVDPRAVCADLSALIQMWDDRGR